MTAANPFSSFSPRPWTLWENPFTRFPKNCVKSLPLEEISAFFRFVSNNEYVKPVWDNRPARFSASVIRFGYSNPVTQLAYVMAERIFNSTAVLRSFSDIDSLTKAVMVTISIAGLWLGPKHPFIADLELANKALGGLIFAKHLVALINQKCYMDAYDKKGNLILGKVCKSLALSGFQIAHGSQTYEFQKKIGLFHMLCAVPGLGFVAKTCIKRDLGPIKNPAVVISAIIAVAAVGEWAVARLHKGWPEGGTLRQAFAKFSYTQEEKIEQMLNGINNATKALVVATQAGWVKPAEPLSRAAGDILGLTNLVKGGGYEDKKNADALEKQVQFSELYTNPPKDRPTLPKLVRIDNKALFEKLSQKHKFI